MKSKWQELKLGTLCKFQEGYVNPSQTNPQFFDGDIKWLRANDLNNSNIYNTSRTLTRKGFDSAGKSALLFNPNTIVISKSGTIGRLGIIKDYMCGNRAIINIEPNENQNTLFIFYLLKSFQKRFEDFAVGSVQKNLYVPILANIKFNIPPINIQNNIVKLLNSIDKKIELNNKINNNFWFINDFLMNQVCG